MTDTMYIIRLVGGNADENVRLFHGRTHVLREKDLAPATAEAFREALPLIVSEKDGIVTINGHEQDIDDRKVIPCCVTR